MNFCVSVRWEPSNVSFYTLKKTKKKMSPNCDFLPSHGGI